METHCGVDQRASFTIVSTLTKALFLAGKGLSIRMGKVIPFIGRENAVSKAVIDAIK